MKKMILCNTTAPLSNTGRKLVEAEENPDLEGESLYVQKCVAENKNILEHG